MYTDKYIFDNYNKNTDLEQFNLDLLPDDEVKSKGVVYTPPFLANFMIHNILDVYDDITWSTILDPACGCGVFVIEAAKYLFEKYTKMFDKELPIKVKKSILLKHLRALDIDSQAIEITKARLCMLLGEYHDFSSIILQRNSLACMWPSCNVIIGNPPYVRCKNMEADTKELVKYYKTYNGNADLSSYFIEKAMTTLTDNGILTYVTSNTWLKTEAGKKLRNFISQYDIAEMIDLAKCKLFNATVSTHIIVFKKSKPKETMLYAEPDNEWAKQLKQNYSV